MTPRDTILAAVRKNLPRPAVPLPDFSPIDFKRYKERTEVKHSPVDSGLLSSFQKQLEAMGGRWFVVADAAGVGAKLSELFPYAKVLCSAVPEVPNARRVEQVSYPHQLNDVDVGVVRSPLAIAEAGAIWLTQSELVVNALGVLSQHLVVLLDSSAVVQTMHDAYERLDLTASPYGVFMAGPSATGDIEGVIIPGAQGARSLTVLFVAPQAEGNGAV